MAYNPNNPNGSATSANSAPVVIASDQSAVPVSGTVTANIGTVATLATAAKQDTGNTSLATVAGAVAGTEMQVDVLTMPTVTVNAHAVTNAGTFAVQNTQQGTASQNVAQIAGTTADANSGLKSAGTLRVVLATDQPALTNKLLVTPDSVALPANQSVNVSQINGVTPLMGTGVMGTGSPRVTIASDNDPLIVKQATAGNLNATVVGTGTFAVQNTAATPAGTNNIGDMDVLTVNGVAPAFGSGVRGATVQRVTIATDDVVPVSDNSGSLTVDVADLTATGNITTQNLVPAGAATAGSAIEVASLNGQTLLGIQVTGTYTGALSLQSTIDGSTWVTQGGLPFLNINTGAQTATIASATVGIFQADCAGFQKIRLTALAAVTGTAVATIRASMASGLVALDAPLPTGTNTIGSLAANQSSDVAQINGVTPLMGNGVSGSGALRVATTSDGTLGTVTTVSTLTSITNWGNIVDDAAFTPATTRVMMAGFQADETSTDSVDEGDGGAARMTLDRKQIVTPQSHTNGGATPYMLISAATTNATSVKASAGQIYSIAVTNINAAVRYLKLYNKASAPTVGTDTPLQVYAIPGATTGGGLTLSIPVGMEFTTGIAFAITTGVATADTGAVAANEQVINLTYK